VFVEKDQVVDGWIGVEREDLKGGKTRRRKKSIAEEAN